MSANHQYPPLPPRARLRQVQEYRGRPQLRAAGGAAWLVIRKKQALREAFQKVPIGVAIPAAASSAGGGGVDDEDPDPDGDSPPSGPDAGGGEADAVLPSSEWEVQASSTNYTMSQVDQDRCGFLQGGVCGVSGCSVALLFPPAL